MRRNYSCYLYRKPVLLLKQWEYLQIRQWGLVQTDRRSFETASQSQSKTILPTSSLVPPSSVVFDTALMRVEHCYWVTTRNAVFLNALVDTEHFCWTSGIMVCVKKACHKNEKFNYRMFQIRQYLFTYKGKASTCFELPQDIEIVQIRTMSHLPEDSLLCNGRQGTKVDVWRMITQSLRGKSTFSPPYSFHIAVWSWWWSIQFAAQWHLQQPQFIYNDNVMSWYTFRFWF